MIPASFANSIRRFNKAMCWIERPMKAKLSEKKMAMLTSSGSLKNKAIRGENAMKSSEMPTPKSELTQKSVLTCL